MMKTTLKRWEERTWKCWLQQVALMVLTTGCVVAVLMVTANDPSQDDLERGLVAGFVGHMTARLFGGG
jgi:hypothetical protein